MTPIVSTPSRPYQVLAAAVLVIAATLVAVVGAEVALRVGYPWLPGRVQAVIAHVRLWGGAGRALGPSWLDYCIGDTDLAARNRPGLDAAPVQFGPAYYHLSTETLGFNDVAFRRVVRGPPWDGVVVGDSFSFCHHVEAPDCWVGLLAARSSVRLADLAVPATGSVSHSRYLESYGRRLAPALVIWQYWVNDPRDDAEHVLGHRTPCPLQAHPQRVRNWRERIRDGSALANLAHNVYRRVRGHGAAMAGDARMFASAAGVPMVTWVNEAASPASALGQHGFRLTTGAIGLGARRTQAAGGRFLLLVAPSNLQVYADDLVDPDLRAEQVAQDWVSDELIAYAHEHDIEVLDLRPAFREAARAGQVLYPAYDVHWTPAGNALAADILADWLREAGLAGDRRGDTARARRGENLP